MNLKESKTFKNLEAAFAGESMARNKYTYFAEIAKANGMEEIARYFLETARNEQEHAKLWFKAMHDDQMPTIDEALQMGADGENYEHNIMYPEMAAVAREEGFTKIAIQMEMVAKIEEAHEKRYLALLKDVKNDAVFVKEENVTWICEICGHKHIGEKAPGMCPLCMYPKSHFAVDNTDF